MKRVTAARKLHRIREFRLPLRRVALAAFFILGICGGYAFALQTADVLGEELLRYWERFLSVPPVYPDGSVVLKTLVSYLRGAFFILLLGFSFAGVILLPLLCAAESFLFSFSLFSFSAVMGKESFFLLLLIFSARFALLPISYCMASEALDRSIDLALLSFGTGKRCRPVQYPFDYWIRVFVTFACLTAAAVFELNLLPNVLQLLIF